MPKWSRALVAVLVLSALGYYFFGGPGKRDIANYPSAGTDVIAFGDSLVAGVGATPQHDFVSVLSGKAGIPIVNLGVPGNTTAQGLARLDALDAYRPKIVLLLLGGNDYLQKVPIETTFVNLAKIIEHLQGRGAIVVLLGVRGGVFSDAFEAEYEKLSRRYRTAYVSDVLDGLLGKREYMSDQVHPNDAGYAVIAERIYPVLAALMS